MKDSKKKVGSKKNYHVVAYVVIAAICMFAMAQVNSDLSLADRVVPALTTLFIALLLGFILAYLLRGLNDAVESDPESLKVVASCADPLEASTVISFLGEHDIEAKPMGEYTSSFQVEAPGDVKVVVRQSDLARAQFVVEQLSMSVQPSE